MDQKSTEAYSAPTSDVGSINPSLFAPPPYTDPPPEYSEFLRESYIHTTYQSPSAQSSQGLNSSSTGGHLSYTAAAHQQYHQHHSFPGQQATAYGFQQPTAVYGSQQSTAVYGYQAQSLQTASNRFATTSSYQSVTMQTPRTGTRQTGTTFLATHPTPTNQIAEITNIGRRKTVAHITDLSTGKEYNIMKKQSRSGRRSKEIIREVGGPTTIIKQTPSKTIVRQK